MLCICQGPTLRTSPAGAPGKVHRLDAGMVQRALAATVGLACEHSNTIQHRWNGRAVLTIQERRIRKGASGLVLSEAAALRAAGDPLLAEMLPEQVERTVVSETVGPQESWTSPSVVHLCTERAGQPVALADFPDGFAFGNGVTCNSWVRLSCGESKLLSWCVLTPAAWTRHRADAGAREALRQIFEGV